MERKLYSTLIIPIFLVIAPAIQAQTFMAHLTGRAEYPPVMTHAYGEVMAEMDADTLVVSGWFRNLGSDLNVNIAGGAHIHMAYAGRNGGVIHPLTVDADTTLRNGMFDPAKNRFTLTAEQQTALRERALYINIHSVNHGGGEIRGQLQPQADAYYTTNLFGSYELPMVMSSGHGALVLDLVEDTLTVSGSFGAMTSPINVAAAGGMHLHMASAGSNGGISIPLNVDPDTSGMNGIISADSNRHTITGEQKAALANRMLYANVHSLNFPGGELRGQVTPPALTVFRGYLAGSNQVPFVMSRADGMVIAELGADSSLTVSGSFTGIRSGVATNIAGGAHIHMALAGSNGGIELFLNSDLNPGATNGTFQADSNVFQLNNTQLTALTNRALYANIHSNAVTSGEIRGQLLPESQVVFNANLSSAGALPPVRSAAAGLVKAELTENQLILSGSLAGLSSDVDTNILGGAHVHLAPAGSTGGVSFPVSLTFNGQLTEATLLPSANVYTLDADQRRALLGRGAYVNVHTENYGSGEIRSQILPEAKAYFLASLSGTQHTVPVNTSAIGQASLELHRGGNAVVTGSFRDLSGKLATNILGGVHIHTGWAGQNGPVHVPIASTLAEDSLSGLFMASENTIALSDGIVDTLMQFGLYMNVHSTEYAGGEIRGQLLPIANAHLTTQLRSINAVQPIANTGAHGAVTAVLTGSGIRLAGTFADLSGDFAGNIAGGVHIHGSARAGTNAGILVGLHTVVAPDLRSGVFPADTVYQLDPADVQSLLAGNTYVNIHTTAHPGGELRGQLLSAFNAFPVATSEITTPLPGSVVEVRSDDDDPFAVSWSASQDADSIAYILQLTVDPTFTVIPLQVNTAGERTLTGFTNADIDTLLADLGIAIGVPIVVQARIVASDGSVLSTGQTSAFTLVREMPSATTQLPRGWEFNVYPTLASTEVNVDLKTSGAIQDDLHVVLVGIDGRVWQDVDLSALSNGSFQNTINVNGLAEGLWFVMLRDREKILATQRFAIQR